MKIGLNNLTIFLNCSYAIYAGSPPLKSVTLISILDTLYAELEY